MMLKNQRFKMLSELIKILQPIDVVNFTESSITDVICRPEESSSSMVYGVFDEYLRYGVWTAGNNLLSAILIEPAAYITEHINENTSATQIIVQDALVSTAKASKWFWNNPDEKLLTIGITGTKGKTTTAHLVSNWLSLLETSCASLGTLGLNMPNGEIFEVGYTTPIAPDLYRNLSFIREQNCKAVAMEVSSHAIALKRNFGLKLDVKIFTNLGRDHLDFHKSIEEYRKIKEKLFLEEGGVSILNIDDEVGRSLLHRVSNSISYGLSAGAAVYGAIVSMDNTGTDLDVTWNNTVYRTRCPLLGQFNVMNFLAAAATCVGLGHDLKRVLEFAPRLTSVPGRLQVLDIKGGVVGVVDFAHTPESLQEAIFAVRNVTHGRIILVFGCGGDRDKGKRPLMGAIASKFADHTIVTSDNPRSESPESVIDDIALGFKANNFDVEPDRRKAIAQGFAKCKAGDVLLIAGKGHETKQIFATHVEHFSDIEELLCLR